MFEAGNAARVVNGALRSSVLLVVVLGVVLLGITAGAGEPS
jgi:hypothetical protein